MMTKVAKGFAVAVTVLYAAIFPATAFADHDPDGLSYIEREQEIAMTLVNGWYTPEEAKYFKHLGMARGSIGGFLLAFDSLPIFLPGFAIAPPIAGLIIAAGTVFLADGLTDGAVTRAFQRGMRWVWRKTGQRRMLTRQPGNPATLSLLTMIGAAQLSHDDPRVRAAALEALGEDALEHPDRVADSDRTVRAIRQLLETEKNPRVRLVAERILRQLPHPEPTPSVPPEVEMSTELSAAPVLVPPMDASPTAGGSSITELLDSVASSME